MVFVWHIQSPKIDVNEQSAVRVRTHVREEVQKNIGDSHYFFVELV